MSVRLESASDARAELASDLSSQYCRYVFGRTCIGDLTSQLVATLKSLISSIQSRPILLVWLLAYLVIVQSAVGHVVLCVEVEGQVSVEPGACPCPGNVPDSQSLVEEPSSSDVCHDVFLTADAHLISESCKYPVSGSVGRPDWDSRLSPFAAGISSVGPPLAYSRLAIYRSIRSTVLLI